MNSIMKRTRAMWTQTKYNFFDLPHTILSDFDEHIWEALIQSTRLFVPYMPKLFYVSSGKDSPLEIDFKNPIGESGEEEMSEFDPDFHKFDSQELRLIKAWVRDDDLPHLETNPAPIINVHRTYEGKTAIIYWVRSSAIEYPVNFRVQAIQYRRDQLKIGLIDYIDNSPIEYLKTWLKWGWGEVAATPFELKEKPPARTVGRPLHSWNRRAIVRLSLGEDKEVVKNDWITDFETGNNGISPAQTTDGEEKTWQRRVWEPYQKRLKQAK